LLIADDNYVLYTFIILNFISFLHISFALLHIKSCLIKSDYAAGKRNPLLASRKLQLTLATHLLKTVGRENVLFAGFPKRFG